MIQLLYNVLLYDLRTKVIEKKLQVFVLPWLFDESNAKKGQF